VLVDMDAGLLFYFAMGASTEVSVFMAGCRAVINTPCLERCAPWPDDQLRGGTASFKRLGGHDRGLAVTHQNRCSTKRIHRHLSALVHFYSLGTVGFIMYAIAATAETNRSPFDLPEGESELVAGYHTEYSGLNLLSFFSANTCYVLYLRARNYALSGGWSAPFSFLTFIPSWIWFFSKLMMSIFVFIWMRGTLPRLRQDQLMNFAWKFVLPLTLLNLMVTALWRFMGEGWARWGVCSAILIAAYILMGRVGMYKEHFGPRRYRYAE